MKYTYQDFEKAADKASFLHMAIEAYRASDEYNMARTAEEYYAQRNTTILETVRYVYSQSGLKAPDFTAANNKIASNFWRRFVCQRATYSLGNGLSWNKEETKDRLGPDFDTFVFKTAKYALMDGVSFGYWNRNKGHTFSAVEFMPLYDETDGTLRAGARFWSLEWGKRPVSVVLYEEDGITTYQGGNYGDDLKVVEPKHGYVEIVQQSDADGEVIVGELNYGALPIFPLYANDIRQCAFQGLRPMIDAYDMIQSGFANDLQDCAEFYMLIGGALGMDTADLEKFRDQLRFLHIGVVDTDNSSVTPYTQEIPYTARKTCLDQLRASMYEAYGALDVANISATARTATEIQAAYQPMDEEADDFEYQIIQFVRGVIELMGIDDFPSFKRNRICNQPEQTNMIVSAAQFLTEKVILDKLPFLTPEEVQAVLKEKEKEREQEEKEKEREREAKAAEQGAVQNDNGEPQGGNPVPVAEG